MTERRLRGLGARGPSVHGGAWTRALSHLSAGQAGCMQSPSQQHSIGNYVALLAERELCKLPAATVHELHVQSRARCREHCGAVNTLLQPVLVFAFSILRT